MMKFNRRSSRAVVTGTALMLMCACSGSQQASPKPHAKRDAAKEEVDRAMIECAQAHGQTPSVKQVTVVVKLDKQGRPSGVDFHPSGGEMDAELAKCLESRFRAIEFPVPAEAGDTMNFTMKYD